MSRETQQRRSHMAPTVETTVIDTRPLTPVEPQRLRQRYARLRGRSVVLGYTSLGIGVPAATPDEMREATDAVITEATRSQVPS
jgi:hypothetical protein